MIIRYIRHGSTIGNEKHRAVGELVDYKLSEKGIKDLYELKEKGIYPIFPGHCFSSELSRAYDTLHLIYPNALITKTSLLNERCFGEMEYMNDEDEKKYKEKIEFEPWGCDPDFEISPGGESVNMFKRRVKRDFDKLLNKWFDNEYELVTICGHGAYLKGLQLAYNIEDMYNPIYSLIKNGNICVFEVTKENGENIIRYKDVIGIGTKEEIFQVAERKKMLEEKNWD